MYKHKAAPAAIGLALTLFGLAGGAEAQSPTTPPSCFATRDWNGWRGSPDAKTVYLRVSGRRIYQVDFAAPCSGVEWQLSHLVVRQRGSGWICNPIDLDLSVSDGHGFKNRCFIRKITPLSAQEAAALPANLRP